RNAGGASITGFSPMLAVGDSHPPFGASARAGTRFNNWEVATEVRPAGTESTAPAGRRIPNLEQPNESRGGRRRRSGGHLGRRALLRTPFHHLDPRRDDGFTLRVHGIAFAVP